MHREGWKLNPTTPLIHPFENGCLMLIVQILTILEHLFHPFKNKKQIQIKKKMLLKS